MDFYFILWIFVISLSINLFFFLITFIFKVNVLTDIIYCFTFVILSITIVVWKQNFSPVQICLFILYNVWTLRLAIYLLLKITNKQIEYRFVEVNSNFWKFGMFWVLQALTISIISMPTLFALSLDSSYFNAVFSNYLIIFISFAILFLVIEIIADWQKFKFFLKTKNNLFFINYGLWKDCRHPNYLAAIAFWYMMTGLFLCDLLLKNVSNNNNYWLHLLWLLSPLIFNIIIINIADIPILEVKQWQILHNNPDYQQYLKKTSCVMCYIGKKGPINKVKKLILI